MIEGVPRAGEWDGVHGVGTGDGRRIQGGPVHERLDVSAAARDGPTDERERATSHTRVSPPGVPVTANPAGMTPEADLTRATVASAFLAELERPIHAEIAASQQALDARLATLEQTVASLHVPTHPAYDPSIDDARLGALEEAVTALQQAPAQPLYEPAPAIGEERLAAMEQRVMQLDWRVQEWTGTDTTAVEERVAAMEQTLTNLDRFARTLPPARWHQMHDARKALSWSDGSPHSNSRYSKPRGSRTANTRTAPAPPPTARQATRPPPGGTSVHSP